MWTEVEDKMLALLETHTALVIGIPCRCNEIILANLPKGVRFGSGTRGSRVQFRPRAKLKKKKNKKKGYILSRDWAYSRCECFVINIQSRKKSHKHHER
jgi:hypothetical protein